MTDEQNNEILEKKVRFLHSCLDGKSFDDADKYFSQIKNSYSENPREFEMMDSAEEAYTSLKELSKYHGPFDKEYIIKLAELKDFLLEEK